MSIAVTCACTMQYRLPDRYAGKRCRCRECGGPIQVPASSTEVGTRRRKRRERAKRRERRAARRATPAVAGSAGGASRAVGDDARAGADRPEPSPRRARRGRRKEAKSRAGRARRKTLAKSTTRRLGPPQQAAIVGERRTLRSSQRRRAPLQSESMHQLAPLRSGDRMENALAGSGTRRRRRRRAAPQGPGRRVHERERAGVPAEAGASKQRRRRRAKTPSAQARRTGAKRPGAARAGRPARRGRAERAPRRSAGVRGRRLREKHRDSDERDERLMGKGGSATRRAQWAILAIVGVLCLGVGVLVGGGVFALGGADPTASGAAGDLESLRAAVVQRNWPQASAQLAALAPRFEGRPTPAFRELREAVQIMTQIVEIEDDEQRLATLLRYSEHENALVRHAIAWELRPLAPGIEDAQEVLAALAQDRDARTAEAARQALVQAGGPYALPYLEDAIVRLSAAGSRQADVALERALELEDPAVVPVLCKVLEVRRKAPAPLLLRVIGRIAEFGDPSAAPALETFRAHADPQVAKAAAEALEELQSAGS